MKHITLILALTTTACMNEHNVGNTPQPFGSPRWAVSAGGPLNDSVTALAIDHAGDVIAGGALTDGASFGAGPVATLSPESVWISKRAADDGAPLWTLALGTERAAQAQLGEITTDVSGNVLVSGSFYGCPSAFPPEAVIGGGVVVLAKYSPLGELVWSRGFGAGSHARGLHVALGPGGRIYLSGTYQGVIQLATGMLTSDVPASFVVALDGDGALAWGLSVGGTDRLRLAVAPDGSLIATGSLRDRTSIGGITVTPIGFDSRLAFNVTAEGAVIWAHTLGSSDVERSSGLLALGQDGEVIETSNHLKTAQVSATDAAGDELWSATPDGEVEMRGLTVMPSGAIVTGGFITSASVDFGDGAMTGPGFLAAHDPDGHFLSSRSFGDRYGAGIAIMATAGSTAGRVAFVGTIDGPVDVGTGPLPYVNQQDAAIVLLDAP